MENTKVLQLNDDDELIISSPNKGSVLIKNNGGILNITDLSYQVSSNMVVKTLNMNEINSFVITKMLEDSEMSCHRENMDNQKLINKMLDNQFSYICGGNYISDEIKSIQFQAITYFEK